MFGKTPQNKAGEIIKKHYRAILRTGEWDYHLFRKSSTITDLGALLKKTTGNRKLSSLQHEAAGHIIAGLDSLQVARKKKVSLHVERMPTREWVLIIFLTVLLLFSLLFLPSYANNLDIAIKAIFGTLIIQIVILLYGMDTLRLSEATLGESSARDIVEIIAGKR